MRIFKTSAGGREQVLAVKGPGSSIAELPVFDGGAHRHLLRPSTTLKFFSSLGETFGHVASIIRKSL